MKPENGFPEGRPSIPLPQSFFSEILPRIQNLASLKILLFATWISQTSENTLPVFDSDFLQEQFFSGEKQDYQIGLDEAIKQGFLLQAHGEMDGQKRSLCFLNTAEGRAVLEAISNGQLRFNQIALDKFIGVTSPPNIFKLYEENIGVITPIIADHLKDLELTYSADWVMKAIQTALKNNARSLRYIEVVLKNWQEEGKYDGTDQGRRRKTQEEYDPEGYTDGEFSDFIDS